jgi:hypothetical protein
MHIMTVTGTTHSFDLDDKDNWLRFTNGSSITATVPNESVIPFSVGNTITVEQAGAGALTIAAASGVTIRTPETLVLAKQYAVATLMKIGANEWVLTGNLTAAA